MIHNNINKLFSDIILINSNDPRMIQKLSTNGPKLIPRWSKMIIEVHVEIIWDHLRIILGPFCGNFGTYWDQIGIIFETMAHSPHGSLTSTCILAYMQQIPANSKMLPRLPFNGMPIGTYH